MGALLPDNAICAIRAKIKKETAMNNSSTLRFLVFATVCAMFVGLYLSAFVDISAHYWVYGKPGVPFDGFGIHSTVRAVAISAVLLVVIGVFNRWAFIPKWLVRYRYVLSVALLIVFCVLGVSGSSIGVWSEFLGADTASGTLFGIPRSIRSDEWLVTTPFWFSQIETGNLPVSPVIRGGETDITLVQPLQSWWPTTLFRPFLWGFLLLGKSGGLAFYWASRMLALSLLTYELCKTVLSADDCISVAGTLLLVFAPVVQWWSIPVGIPVFGEALVLCFNSLISKNRSVGSTLSLVILLVWLLCCFAFELYPAWQIPFVYIFIGLAILACSNSRSRWSHSKLSAIIKKIILPLGLAVLFCIAIVVVAVYGARDAVMLMMGTSYPGSRFVTGGEGLEFLLTFAGNCALAPGSPLLPGDIAPNVCVSATAIALFPLGLLLSMWLLVKKRNTKMLCLLVPYALFITFGVVGYPQWLARITLMSNVPTVRLWYPLSFLDILMLIYSLACIGSDAKGGEAAQLTDDSHSASTLIVVMAAFCFAVMFGQVAYAVYTTVHFKMAVLTVAVFFLGAVSTLRIPGLGCRGPSASRWILVWALTVVCVGICINPIQHGVAEITDDDLSLMIGEIRDVDPDALWVADNHILAQACVAEGARTLTSVNSYPNLNVWEKIDTNDEFIDVYNRYAHINTSYAEDVSFQVVQGDVFTVNLDEDAIKILGIDYWVSKTNLSEHNSETMSFVPVGEDDGATIFRIDYAEENS